ncbi:MAG: CBS domain-containing protein [Candidatus Methylomirabilales bacterium]
MDVTTVGKIMSQAPVVVEPQAPLREACRLMAEHHIRHIPVVSADGLVGVISDRDVRESLPAPSSQAGSAECAAAMDRIAVWEVMVEEVVTVTPRTPLAQAVHLLAGHKIGCLPVMDSGRLVGIVTETDVLQAFAGLLDDLSGSPRLEVGVPDTPGRLQEVSRLFADVPSSVGNFVGAWTGPVSPEGPTTRILVLRFQAFEPQEVLRMLEGAGIRVLYQTEEGGER